MRLSMLTLTLRAGRFAPRSASSIMLTYLLPASLVADVPEVGLRYEPEEMSFER